MQIKYAMSLLFPPNKVYSKDEYFLWIRLIMRLWSLHPSYLDNKGLTALWREALLARKVLQGRTRSSVIEESMKKLLL
jgi:hypothetical protein